MNNKITCILISSLACLSMIGCNKDSNDGKRQKNNQVEKFTSTYKNERKYNTNYFNNPNNKYRVLPVNHKSALSSGGMSMSKVDEYMEQGYGGFVSNVSLGDSYLKSASAWDLMKETVDYAVDTYDSRVMIYDEEYYPSGAARTNTLEAAPEGENWEAQGLVYNEIKLTKDVPVTLAKREGHEIIHAYVYKAKSLINIDPTAAVDVLDTVKEGSKYTPTEDGLMVILYAKNWYEGTHYQNNLMESRRYIDLLKKEPVEKFIEITYQRYYDHFKEYFGNNIESFFFDEPSLPGMYFSPTSPQVLHEVNPLIEQYPAVNYDDKICERFKEKYGYDPSPYLPYLFEKTNQNDNIRRFRWQYYSLISELVENNWAGQLTSWCDDHDVLSGGHYLAEEDISDHPLMLGNYLNQYHKMSMPGVDMTHGSALDAISIGANVAKQATSVASFDNKQNVFCEIGQDEASGSSVDDNIANVAILQSMGINYLTSYYKYKTQEDNERFANALARINYMLDGNTSEKDVGVYYPIEGVFVDETPYNSSGARIYTGSWGFNQYVTEINNNYRTLLQTMVKNQIDYSIFTEYMILGSKVEDGKMVTPNRETYTTFIVPYTTALPYRVLEKLNEFAEGGVNIVLQNIETLLCEDSDKQLDMDDNLAKLKGNENTSSVSNSIASIISAINSNNAKAVNLSTPNSNIVACKHDNINNTLYMLVNASSKPQTVTIIADEVGSEYSEWDVYTGEVNGMCVAVKNNKSYLTVQLPAYHVGIYTIGGK